MKFSPIQDFNRLLGHLSKDVRTYFAQHRTCLDSFSPKTLSNNNIFDERIIGQHYENLSAIVDF